MDVQDFSQIHLTNGRKHAKALEDPSDDGDDKVVRLENEEKPSAYQRNCEQIDATFAAEMVGKKASSQATYQLAKVAYTG